MKQQTFAEQVYRCIRKIPKGQVATYSSVARAIGHPRAARAVGNALNKNPYAPITPCHRVVRFNGEIGGFALGTKSKQKLLETEGVKVNHQRVNLTECEYEFKA